MITLGYSCSAHTRKGIFGWLVGKLAYIKQHDMSTNINRNQNNKNNIIKQQVHKELLRTIIKK